MHMLIRVVSQACCAEDATGIARGLFEGYDAPLYPTFDYGTLMTDGGRWSDSRCVFSTAQTTHQRPKISTEPTRTNSARGQWPSVWSGSAFSQFKFAKEVSSAGSQLSRYRNPWTSARPQGHEQNGMLDGVTSREPGCGGVGVRCWPPSVEPRSVSLKAAMARWWCVRHCDGAFARDEWIHRSAHVQYRDVGWLRGLAKRRETRDRRRAR
jgi:hypothetical protein